MGVIVLGVVMLLAGGPREFMLACEGVLQSMAEAIYQGWLNFTR